MKIGKLTVNQNRKELSIVCIDNQDFKLYNRSFFKFDKNNELKRNRQGKVLIKEQYQNIFSNDKPVFCLVEINNYNQIKEILEMPHLPKYLKAFYLSQRDNYDNYALAVEKFPNISKKKATYMHQNGTKLYYKSNFGKRVVPNKSIIELVKNKQETLLASLSDNYQTGNIVLKQNWRLATGLGNASVYNNGFSFHPVYGIPYLSGQQIKGIVRVYVIATFFNYKEEEAVKDEYFAYLFGRNKIEEDNTTDNENSGAVTFFDAFPVNNEVKMEADIMAPHYKNYYGEKGQPNDKDSPDLIIFLSIKKGTFKFAFGIKKSKYKEQIPEDTEIKVENSSNTLDLIKKLIEKAMDQEGIGAKTAVGYGRLKV